MESSSTAVSSARARRSSRSRRSKIDPSLFVVFGRSANGYLPHQFLDTYSNHRTDNYGGSVENRARFAVECLEAILTVWDANRVG